MRRQCRKSKAMKNVRTAIYPVASVMVGLALTASAHAAASIDTISSWNGSSYISSWGVTDTATYGQTITTTSATLLRSATFELSAAGGATANFQAYVYQWDPSSSHIVGSALYTSAVMTAPSGSSFAPVTITPDVMLAGSSQYVIFFSTSGLQTGQPHSSYHWGSVGSNTLYTGGQFVYMNNTDTFSLLGTNVWSNITQDLAMQILLGPDIYTATLNQGNYLGLGAAAVLDNSMALSGLFSSLTTEKEISDAVTQTLPLLAGGTSSATQAAISTINDVVQSRIEGKRGLSSSDDHAYDRNIWVKTFGAWGDQDDRNGIPGFKSDTYGLVGGFDGKVAANARLGGALAYAKLDIDGESAFSTQSADIDVFEVIGYGNYSVDDQTNIFMKIGLGINNIDGTRRIDFVSSTASSDFDGRDYFIGAGIDRTWMLNDKTKLTPSLKADFIRVDEYGYDETGADLLNLSVDKRTSDALIFGTDVNLTYSFSDQLSAFGVIGVGYDAINDRASIVATFAGAPTASFLTNGIDPSPWIYDGGIGVTYKVKSGLDLTARYDADYRSDFLNQALSLKLNWQF